ncbi:SLC13 family permease [Microbacterium sp. BWT-B31]|uniref:SLC13 family permease n=1 Tax=Microbacterium sp. BWT-B31 TaxID=3232072 RepID=UPI0035290EE5
MPVDRYAPKKEEDTMTWELALVLALLAAAIAMFAIGRPRMDVVAVLMIVALPLTGILTIDQTLAGFADPNVVLIAALFVVGEGLSRTGVTYRIGDWLARTAGSSEVRLLVLLMLSVAMLGAVMSSTGVVAIFIPIVLSVASRTGMSPRQLMMPLSFAGLISGTLTLIATAPNLVVDAELTRSGSDGFGFFTFTPFGLVILVLGIAYMLVARRLLGGGGAHGGRGRRRTFRTLLSDYEVDSRTHRYRVRARSPLEGVTLADAELGDPDTHSILAMERTRLWRTTVRMTADQTPIARGDILIVEAEVAPDDLGRLGLEEIDLRGDFFDSYARQVGIAELTVTPDSDVLGKQVRELRFRATHGLSILGMRHAGRNVAAYPGERLRAGDTILVAGAWTAIQRLQDARHDFVLLDLPAEVDEVAPAANQAPFALLSLAVMIVLMVTGWVPNVVAALIACLLMGLFRCIDMTSAYRAIHWPTLLLIVGMLPFAEALQVTGGVDLAVDGLLAAVGGAGPYVILAGLFLLTAVIGLFVSNTATAVLMAPIAIAIAQQLGLSPYPFAMIIALAASSAFMTPVSSPVNTLVLEPGRYSFGDFAKVGVPFTLIVLVVSVLLVPVLLPF